MPVPHAPTHRQDDAGADAAPARLYICAPACGTGCFLVASEEHLMANYKKEIFFDRVKKDYFLNHMFFVYYMDRTMLRIGAMNMMTHG